MRISLKKWSIPILLITLVVGCQLDGSVNIQPSVIEHPGGGQIKGANGVYHSLMLPCRCGCLLVYEPNSCPCFSPEDYPDLVISLVETYRWFGENCGYNKCYLNNVGDYDNITLTCGCSLCVYIPGSSTCLEKKYPELAHHLRRNYELANKYKDK